MSANHRERVAEYLRQAGLARAEADKASDPAIAEAHLHAAARWLKLAEEAQRGPPPAEAGEAP